MVRRGPPRLAVLTASSSGSLSCSVVRDRLSNPPNVAAHPLAVMIRLRQSGAAACSATIRWVVVLSVSADSFNAADAQFAMSARECLLEPPLRSSRRHGAGPVVRHGPPHLVPALRASGPVSVFLLFVFPLRSPNVGAEPRASVTRLHGPCASAPAPCSAAGRIELRSTFLGVPSQRQNQRPPQRDLTARAYIPDQVLGALQASADAALAIVRQADAAPRNRAVAARSRRSI